MSKIEDEARYDLIKDDLFNDTYRWQVDREENHRLIHTRTGDASDWQIKTAPVVLHDKFVLPQHYSLYLPTDRLMRWEIVNN